MSRLLFFVLAFGSTLATAQSNLIAIDTLWIHKADPNEEDLDSYFPILNSPAKPTVAHNVNTALQMQALGYILTNEKKVVLLNQPSNPRERANMSFAFKRMTDRFFYIDILLWNVNNSMSLNGWNQINRYYFDATNGHPVSLHEVLFNNLTIVSQMGAVESGFMESMVKVMKKYNNDFRLQDLAAIDKDCECNCTMSIKNAYRENRVRFGYDESLKILQFSMDDCDWMNPRAHDTYETNLRKDETDPWLTPYGRYLIYGGTPVANNAYFKMWKGMIDGKIPITFFLWVDNITVIEGHGLEIYDRHGVSISLNIKVTSDGSLEMQELANEGKAVATITSKLESGNLVGKWVKADGSKTLSFTASPAK